MIIGSIVNDVSEKGELTMARIYEQNFMHTNHSSDPINENKIEIPDTG